MPVSVEQELQKITNVSYPVPDPDLEWQHTGCGVCSGDGVPTATLRDWPRLDLYVISNITSQDLTYMLYKI